MIQTVPFYHIRGKKRSLWREQNIGPFLRKNSKKNRSGGTPSHRRCYDKKKTNLGNANDNSTVARKRIKPITSFTFDVVVLLVLHLENHKDV